MTKTELHEAARSMVAEHSSREILDALSLAAENHGELMRDGSRVLAREYRQRARQFAHMAETAKKAGV